MKRILQAGTLLLFLVALTYGSISYQDGKNSVSPAGLFQEGDRLRRQGEYDKSAAILSRCLKESRKEGQAVLELDSLLSLGLVYWNTG